jgi:hypothetical protein
MISMDNPIGVANMLDGWDDAADKLNDVETWATFKRNQREIAVRILIGNMARGVH